MSTQFSSLALFEVEVSAALLRSAQNLSPLNTLKAIQSNATTNNPTALKTPR